MAPVAAILHKLQFLKAWVAQTLENTSLVIRSTLLSLIIFYLIGLFESVYNILAVTPGYLIPPNFRIWTLVTGGLVETSFIYVIIDIGILLICGRQLEPLWGALELLKFLGLLDIFSSLSTTALCLIAYLTTKKSSIWFATFSGMAGICGGVSVAFKQIMPDQKIDLMITEIKVEIIPPLLLFSSSIFAAVGIIPSTSPLQFFSGIVVAWIYLRFYQPRGKGVKGDTNENFAFASFFPAPLRPAILKFSVITFNTLVKVGLCKTPVRTYDVGAPSAITISLPGVSPTDAERRRRKALRALNERLKKEQENREEASGENWPSIDDETSKNMAEANDVIVDLENNSSSDADVEIIDKNETEEK